MGENRTKRIMWVSPMCSLDRRSGAACQIRSVLSTLSEAGWESSALEMTVFDGQDAYPVGSIIGEKNNRMENVGKTFLLQQDGVEHHLYLTSSTYGREIERQEEISFASYATEKLKEVQPDVVITYGSSMICRAIHRIVRDYVGTMIFYLANPNYRDPDLFELFDQVLVPSEFQRDYYRERLGIESDVLRTLIPENSIPDPSRTIAASAPESRHFGFITMVNPSLPKGATLFARLVELAEERRPDWLFLAVESRMTDEEWATAGLDLAGMRNIWWIPNQQDVRPIYERSSVLLFPSFWNEASGRSIAEAQLGGVPVVASNHAGIPEQLNGGGFCVDVPERCREHFQTIPSAEEVEPWFQIIEQLMDNDATYRETVERALSASAMFSRDAVQRDVVERFEKYAKGEGLRKPLPNT